MQIEIIDIPLIEFFRTPSKDFYLLMSKNIKPTNEFRGKELKDINTILFDDVTALKMVLGELSPQNAKIVTEVFSIDFDDVGFYEFIGVWKYAIELIEKIIKLENGIQPYIPSEYYAAGVDKFNELKSDAIKIPIGRKFGVEPFKVGKWKWVEVFKIRKFEALESHFNHNLQEIYKSM